jgi:hypothetical protein
MKTRPLSNIAVIKHHYTSTLIGACDSMSINVTKQMVATVKVADNYTTANEFKTTPIHYID